MDERDELRSKRRRGVMNDARRTVERSLMVADAADELAKAAQSVLDAADPKDVGLAPLREALARYQALSGVSFDHKAKEAMS
jgi:hypothetical protein